MADRPEFSLEDNHMEEEASGNTVERSGRTSAFRETGLIDIDGHAQAACERPISRPTLRVRFRSNNGVFLHTKDIEEWKDAIDDDHVQHVTPTAVEISHTHPPTFSSHLVDRLAIFAFVLAVFIPLLQSSPILGSKSQVIPGAEGGVIRHDARSYHGGLLEGEAVWKRDNSPTNVCKRWGSHSAVVNGTLFLYGGRATTSSQQTDNTWNNDFLSLDLTKSWQIASPALTGLPQPSGPPAVSLGYLWNSWDSLYLYGGEFSEKPQASPTANSLWEYDIKGSAWKEHTDPRTSASINGAGDGQPVQRAAEGAGFSVPSLGRGWFFGGHLDFLTTEGWSYQVPRVYLKSFVEYTFPGYGNAGVKSLGNDKTAGADGVWRNITDAGIQDTAGFTERADGVLTYIPGFGPDGILLALAGGDNVTYTQMNIIDVYDIANSVWYKQATSGNPPKIRVNPCAVVAAAADGSSYNVYMYGGQNLTPAGSQVQYDDIWILSVPSFTWISVDTSKLSNPPARAGHTCNIWDSQMVVVGGYVGQDLSCDSGFYVFNLTSLTWGTQFTALTGSSHGSNVQNNMNDGKAGSATNNPFSQQLSQRGTNSSSGLQGSYGYAVPDVVAQAIGGGPTGGATLTAPVQTPTAGPLATGKPFTYTVTSNGIITTSTSYPDPNSLNKQGSGTNIAAIVAGTIAGFFFLVAAYFAFCAFVYRKQLHLYKNHVAMAQRAAADPAQAEKDAFFLPPGSKNSGRNSGEASTGPSGSGNKSNSRGLPSTSASGTGSGNSRLRTEIGYTGAAGYAELDRKSTASSSQEDLLAGSEPTFWGAHGVLLNPRRSLRVINRD